MGRRLVIALATASLLCGYVPAEANVFIEMTFSEKMQKADLVVVVTVLSTHTDAKDVYGNFAEVETVATLKGTASPRIEVETRSQIAEADPHCCEIGATYVMFLYKAPRQRMASVNGRFGLVRIGPSKREPPIQVIVSSPSDKWPKRRK